MPNKPAHPSLFPLSSSEGRAIPHEVHRPLWLYELTTPLDTVDLQAHLINPGPDDYAGMIACFSSQTSVIEFAEVSGVSLGTGEHQGLVPSGMWVYFTPAHRYIEKISGGTIYVQVLERYRGMTTDKQFSSRMG